MRKIYILAAATAMLFAACDDKPASYDSFELTTAVHDASGAKTHWSASGLFWDNGDKVMINGNIHNISGSGTSWNTTGTQTEAIDDYFYVAYPTGTWDRGTKTVSWNGTKVPLACKGKTNKMTLYPCCAVIKVVGGGYALSFTDSEGNPGTESGAVLTSGTIDVSSATLTGGTEFDYNYEMEPAGDDGDGNGIFVIPMRGNSVSAKLSVDYNETSDVVTLQKGYMYVVDFNK